MKPNFMHLKYNKSIPGSWIYLLIYTSKYIQNHHKTNTGIVTRDYFHLRRNFNDYPITTVIFYQKLECLID